jgi:hypothetical protein
MNHLLSIVDLLIHAIAATHIKPVQNERLTTVSSRMCASEVSEDSVQLFKTLSFLMLYQAAVLPVAYTSTHGSTCKQLSHHHQAASIVVAY